MDIKTVDISKRLRHPYIMPVIAIENFKPVYPETKYNILSVDKNNILKYINQILLALDYAHGRMILLCNLFPENIYYFPDKDIIMIGNFTYSTYDDTVFKHFVPNNKNFLPPEVLIEGTVNEKSDLWILGLTVLQVLNGSNPQEITVKNHKGDYFQQLQQNIDLALKDIKQDVGDILTRILKIDYKQRSSVQELLKLNVFEQYYEENKHIINSYQSCPIVLNFIDTHNIKDYNEQVFSIFENIKNILNKYNNNVYFWILFNAIDLFNSLIVVSTLKKPEELRFSAFACFTLSFKLYFIEHKNNEVYNQVINGLDIEKLKVYERAYLRLFRHKIFRRNIFGFLLRLKKQVNVDKLFNYVINTAYTGELGDYAYKFTKSTQ